MNKFIVSSSPHVHGNDSISKNMYGVLIALIPAFICSVIVFGWGAIITTATSVIACLLFEFLIQKYIVKGKTTIWDGSAMITGVLLAFNVPSSLPLWILIIGALVAIGIGKMTFGGLGSNVFNPALVGRVFLLISFPAQMTTWPLPKGFATSYIDATTGATPLQLIKAGHMDQIPNLIDMLFGRMGGSLGEIATAALLLGFIWLLYKKIITWHIPISIFATVIVFSGIMHLCSPEQFVSPLVQLLTGGLMLGSIFMATDYVTSPMANKGMIIYGIGIGIITVVIRTFGSYPEGVSFAILIMNALTPLINRYCKPARFK